MSSSGKLTPKVIDWARVQAATRIARDNGLIVTPIQEPRVDGALNRILCPAWVVYRKLPDGQVTRLGKRSDPDGLLDFVRASAGLVPIPK